MNTDRDQMNQMKSLLGFHGGWAGMMWGGTLGGLLGVIVWDWAAEWLLRGFEFNHLALLGLAATLNFVVGQATFIKFTDFSRQEWENSAIVHFLTGATNGSIGLLIYMNLAGIYDTLSTITFIYFQSLLFFFSILLFLGILDKALSNKMNTNLRQTLVVFAFGWPFILIGALWAIPLTLVRYLMYGWLKSSAPESLTK